MLGPQAPGSGRLVTTKREPAPLELKSATLSLGAGARPRVQHQQALPKLLTPRGPPDAAGSGSDAGRAHGMSSGKGSGGSPPGLDSNPLRVPKAHRQRTTRPSTQHQQAIETRTRQRVSAEAYRAINSVRSQQAANESVGAGFDAAGAAGVGGSAFEAAPVPPAGQGGDGGRRPLAAVTPTLTLTLPRQPNSNAKASASPTPTPTPTTQLTLSACVQEPAGGADQEGRRGGGGRRRGAARDGPGG